MLNDLIKLKTLTHTTKINNLLVPLSKVLPPYHGIWDRNTRDTDGITPLRRVLGTISCRTKLHDKTRCYLCVEFVLVAFFGLIGNRKE